MELLDWLVKTMRDNPSIPLFLTVALGFWIGKFKYKSFSLGTVTSVLLVGVVVGQLDIEIPGPVKSVFFLMFLFAIGFSVGPQFFRSLRGSGIKQVVFAVIQCVLCLLSVVLVVKIFGYGTGEAYGLFAGANTISAVIGVGTDSINGLAVSAEAKKKMLDIVPVAYAVSYIYGTIGSAYILSMLGPALLGGLKKVRERTRELEAQMNESSVTTDPAYINALRPVVFRAYRADSDFFSQPRSVAEIEAEIQSKGRRIFVDRVRVGGKLIDGDAFTPDLRISRGDEVVLSGRREYVIADESWLGPEVADAELLNFPVEQLPVVVGKAVDGMTVDRLRSQPYMKGVLVVSVTRAGVAIPVLARTELHRGDNIVINGLAREVNEAAPQIGYVDRPTTVTSVVLMGLGIAIGALIGAISIKIGGVPVSLSTSGGALIAGLVCGWLRSRRPTVGAIPESSVWLMNNLGLNMFIAVIGITSGPGFISGLKEVGFMMFLAGIICTTLPLVLGVILGDKVFHFHPAVNLGCCAGARTTTASLGAIQDTIQSTIPAMGYTVTYAIGNTMLILMGVFIVFLV